MNLQRCGGFGVDNGAITLGPVRVGHFASLGMKSIVAPFTSVPDHCHLGPVLSNYEVGGNALHHRKARVNRRCLPEPTLFYQIFVINPITFLTMLFEQIPPFLVIYFMLQTKGAENAGFQTANELMIQ